MAHALGRPTGTVGSSLSFTSGQLPTSAEIGDVRELSRGALDMEFDAEHEVARSQVALSVRLLTGGNPVSTGSVPAAARSLTSASLCALSRLTPSEHA